MARDRRLHGEAGFTLIELLVVVLTLAILTAIAVPSYLGMRDRAGTAAAQADLRTAVMAQELHHGRTGSFAADASELETVTTSADVVLVTYGEADAYCISARHAHMARGVYLRQLHFEGSPTVHSTQCGSAEG